MIPKVRVLRLAVLLFLLGTASSVRAQGYEIAIDTLNVTARGQAKITVHNRTASPLPMASWHTGDEQITIAGGTFSNHFTIPASGSYDQVVYFQPSDGKTYRSIVMFNDNSVIDTVYVVGRDSNYKRYFEIAGPKELRVSYDVPTVGVDVPVQTNSSDSQYVGMYIYPANKRFHVETVSHAIPPRSANYTGESWKLTYHAGYDSPSYDTAIIHLVGTSEAMPDTLVIIAHPSSNFRLPITSSVSVNFGKPEPGTDSCSNVRYKNTASYSVFLDSIHTWNNEYFEPSAFRPGLELRAGDSLNLGVCYHTPHYYSAFVQGTSWLHYHDAFGYRDSAWTNYVGQSKPCMTGSLDTVDLGGWMVGDTALQVITLTNNRDSAVVLTQATFSVLDTLDEFGFVGNPFPRIMPAKSSYSFTLRYIPRRRFYNRQTLTIALDPDNSNTFCSQWQLHVKTRGYTPDDLTIPRLFETYMQVLQFDAKEDRILRKVYLRNNLKRGYTISGIRLARGSQMHIANTDPQSIPFVLDSSHVLAITLEIVSTRDGQYLDTLLVDADGYFGQPAFRLFATRTNGLPGDSVVSIDTVKDSTLSVVSTISHDHSLRIYPNPANAEQGKMLHLELNNVQYGRIELLNALGGSSVRSMRTRAGLGIFPAITFLVAPITCVSSGFGMASRSCRRQRCSWSRRSIDSSRSNSELPEVMIRVLIA